MKCKQNSNKTSYLREILRDNRGSAMITALVVGVVIAGFCLATLLVTYTLYIQADRQSWQLQSRNLAQTFCEELCSEISNSDSEINDDIASRLADAQAGEKVSLRYELDAGDKLSDYQIFAELECEKKASGKCDIDVTVICRKGDGNDRDVQSYTLESRIENVLLN